MGTKLEPVENARHVIALESAGANLAAEFEKFVTKTVRAFYEELQKDDEDISTALPPEQFHGHVWMVITAYLLLTARDNGNEAVVHDWIDLITALERASDEAPDGAAE